MEAGLTINPSKCQFCLPEVKYLGHIVSAEGVKTAPKYNEAVREFTRPTNAHQVRQYLGMSGYYRRFIQGYAEIAAHQELARQRTHKAAEKVITREAHPQPPDNLEVGQMVDIRIRQRDGKLGDRWEGTYCIREKGTKGKYTLEGQDGSVIQANISDIRIKHRDEDASSGEEGVLLAWQQPIMHK